MGAPSRSAGDRRLSFDCLFYGDDNDPVDSGKADFSGSDCGGGDFAAGTAESAGKSGTEKYTCRPVFAGYAESLREREIFRPDDQRDREGMCGDGEG